MGLFGPSLPIAKDEFEWLLACFAWLEKTVGKRAANGSSPRLVLPKDDDLASAKTAPQMFEAVKRAAGLQNWHCRLERGEERPNVSDIGLPTGPSSQDFALGTYSVEGNEPVIRYDPGLLKNPDALAATFAHELAHLVIHSLGMPPGGEALEEHATDCTAVYLGFGVFLANSARNFDQFTDGAMQGWRSETSGYLSENALVSALAVFEHCFSYGTEAKEHLKPYLQPVHRRARGYLVKRYPNLAIDLASIDLTDWE